MPSNADLAALLVVGNARESAQRALDALYDQTIADTMEIVVIDMQTRRAPPLALSSRAATRYVTGGPDMTLARARAMAVKVAHAPIAAFIEPHSTAAPTWAAAVVRAHREPWAAVGYAFTNPLPASYLSRAVIMSKYGRWLHPTSTRATRVLPNVNVAYKREVLLAMGEELESLLTPDFLLHERLNERGLPMCVESGALVANDSVIPVGRLISTSFVFCRILASRRARSLGWTRVHRIAHGLATPVVSPAVALWRLVGARGRTAGGGSVFSYLPLVLLKDVASALGESVGYLIGEGSSEARFGDLELHTDRAGRRQPR
jgi:hypothetical protein